ncbi:hypothetical protein, partial [Nocardia carnea]|uniref:hypothetical protein n=1 Tax=Nocardia carnea TaxID=37328 RepID=UPI0005C2038D
TTATALPVTLKHRIWKTRQSGGVGVGTAARSSRGPAGTGRAFALTPGQIDHTFDDPSDRRENRVSEFACKPRHYILQPRMGFLLTPFTTP